MNQNCYDYLNGCITEVLKHDMDVRFHLNDVYDFFITNGYICSNYTFNKFLEDLCKELDIADYSYTIGGILLTPILTIEMTQ